MTVEYRPIIFNSIIDALIEGQDDGHEKKNCGLGFNRLYNKSKEILKEAGYDVTPSKTHFNNYIKKMVEDNELHITIDEASKLKIKPVYYSLTEDAKRRRHLNLLGVGDEHDRVRKIYEKIFFWEFLHPRPIPIPSEQISETIDKLERSSVRKQGFGVDWGKITDASNDFLRYEVGSREYLEFWNDEEIPEMKILPIDSLYHVTTTPEIVFIKREYWEATKQSKKILSVKYILNLPGISEEELLVYNNKFSDVKFTDKEIEKAFLLLKESGLIKPHLVFQNKTRYVITNEDLIKLIREISKILEEELGLMLSRLRFFDRPTEEEKTRLKWMLGETFAKRIIQSTEISRHENRKAVRDSKNLNEYFEFLRQDLSGFPEWAVENQIYMDSSKFFNKNKDKSIEDVSKDVHGFNEFRRQRHLLLESDLIDGIKDAKKRYEGTVNEYAYLFGHMLRMVCPLLLKLPAESYYSDEEIEAKERALYRLEEELNPPGFHDSIRRHTDEHGYTHIVEVIDDMKKARINHNKKKKVRRSNKQLDG